MSTIVNDIIVRGITVPSSDSKRILFYGACHATIFARIFETFCTDLSYSFDRITNYEIIQSGIPFPYDRVCEWDFIVFSPILNHAGYETERLIEACIKNGVKYLCYPYLHWRGYFPYVEEGQFITTSIWHYPTSVSLAKIACSLESFIHEFSKPFKNDSFIFENLELTTEQLRRNEVLGHCDFIISDFIVKEFRNERLFLIPGHPSYVVYIEAIKRINKFLNIPLDSSYEYSAEDPQYGIKIPIHPSVSDRLGLKFYDADFQNNSSIFANQTIPWSDYLRLAYGFGRSSVMWRANAETTIKREFKSFTECGEDNLVWVPDQTIFQGYAETAEDPAYWKIDITWIEPAIRRKVVSWNNVYIYKAHWIRDVSSTTS